MPGHLVIASSWGLQVLLLSSFSCSSAALAAPDEDGRPRHGSFRHCHMRVKPLSISFSTILIFFKVHRHQSHLPIFFSTTLIFFNVHGRQSHRSTSFPCSCPVFGMPRALCNDTGLLVRSLAQATAVPFSGVKDPDKASRRARSWERVGRNAQGAFRESSVLDEDCDRFGQSPTTCRRRPVFVAGCAAARSLEQEQNHSRRYGTTSSLARCVSYPAWSWSPSRCLALVWHGNEMRSLQCFPFETA